jgi:F0F1-type ATP synthase membrane subunit a
LENILLEYCWFFSTWTSLLVIWFVVAVLLLLSALGTSNADRIPHGFQNFMEAAVDFVTDIAKDQLGESFYKEWIPFIEHYSSFVFGCMGWCSYTVEINRITSRRLAALIMILIQRFVTLLYIAGLL